MENIHLETQSIKGGKTKVQKVGFVVIGLRTLTDLISIDDFEGHGDTYKQREHQKIEIVENSKLLFSGTKHELFEILKGK
jgi:hypothetical protein